MLSLTTGSSDFSFFAGSGLGIRGDFFNSLNKFCAGFFASSSSFLFGMSTKLFRQVFGVVSGEELNSLSSDTSFSGESACMLANRFLRAAAMMAAGSPGVGDLGLDLTGVPPGDLEIEWLN